MAVVDIIEVGADGRYRVFQSSRLRISSSGVVGSFWPRRFSAAIAAASFASSLNRSGLIACKLSLSCFSDGLEEVSLDIVASLLRLGGGVSGRGVIDRIGNRPLPIHQLIIYVLGFRSLPCELPILFH